MCRGPGGTFRPDVKCCMFAPNLPNWLAGAVLADPALPDGAASVRDRLAHATPLGLTRSAAEDAAHAAARDAGEFGLRPDLRCPHWLDDGGGTCGIWPHREAVCATFFCRVERGSVGKAAWNDLRALLSGVEVALARWCLAELGAGPDDWGPFSDDPEGLYRAAAALVEPLSWRDVRRIGGFELSLRARTAKAAWAARSDATLPSHLTRGAVQTAPLPDGRVRVWGYGPYDPLDLDAATLAVLDAFDGRPVAEALAGLGPDAPDLDTLTALVDWRILRPVLSD